ncbi:hypothetical protein H2200_011684 [Cladophialophora chaetospira]|uniref:Oxidoreductase n=1 Tax=Cladophialophora chaetospira TaxID=386627 RepID=A0AA39CDD7_9EURO|nr:hypothetical protein H2200_011684 [Cladophialophora chaetospira]
MPQRAWAVIAGVGSGTGSSIARRFAKNYAVALLSRKSSNFEPIVQEINDAGGKAFGINADTSDAQSIKMAFEQLKKETGGKLAAAVYNVGGGLVKKPFLELKEEELEAAWGANGRGGFLFAQEVLPLLLAQAETSPQYPPTLIFTGATAALKASATFLTFAAGKFAVRAIAQSLAREFGPKGIHVAHAIIDGVIDIEKSKNFDLGPEAKISPDAIADAYWFLHTQPRTCFSQEIDLRPAREKW